MKAGIIDGENKRYYWEAALGSSFECMIAADISKLPDCDIIFVSEEYCGGAVETLIENIRASGRFSRKPVSALTSDVSCENQEILLSLGFDDVITLPICRHLLLRRAKALAALSGNAVPDITVEGLMESPNNDSGAYFVRSEDFTNIFHFMTRVLERSGNRAQILVLMLSSVGEQSSAQKKSTMNILSEAVRTCLRRGDMLSVFSEDRVLVLLIGADDEGGHLVANRVINSFYSECADTSFEIAYDIKAVGAKE